MNEKQIEKTDKANEWIERWNIKTGQTEFIIFEMIQKIHTERFVSLTCMLLVDVKE